MSAPVANNERRLVRIDDRLTIVYKRYNDLAFEEPFATPIRYVGIGGRARYVYPNFNLGVGTARCKKSHGFRRAVYDAAFGYVSGFRKRDIAYFVLTRSLSFRVFVIVLRMERRKWGEQT